MILKATLSHKQHPEYGAAENPFPIPREEYDSTIRMLEGLDIGDPLRQDCRVEEIDSYYSILKRLEGKSVNLDELDYLAKRLDSFDTGEAAQFQAMAEKLNLTDIRDFINLTFCCQQVTVITDFSDLEAIGRDHYMNLHGGSALVEELEHLDGVETAILLIEDSEGTITRYGVVYDNGMKLEQLYDGRHFPCYHYDVNPITAGIVSYHASKETKPRDWVYFPASQSQIERTLARAGAASASDAILCDFENMLPVAVEQGLSLETESIEALNDMCAAIMPLDQKERTKLDAVVAMAAPSSAAKIRHLAENLGLFDFVPGVQTPEEYGKCMIRESEHFEYDPNLDAFYDYAGYGRRRIDEEQGRFTQHGYIAFQGTLTLEELMAADPAEQYQREQSMGMGELA